MRVAGRCPPRFDYRRRSQRVRFESGFLGGREALFRAKLALASSSPTKSIFSSAALHRDTRRAERRRAFLVG